MTYRHAVDRYGRTYDEHTLPFQRWAETTIGVFPFYGIRESDGVYLFFITVDGVPMEFEAGVNCCDIEQVKTKIRILAL